MAIKCPKCRSEKIEVRNIGRTTGAVAGGAAGGYGAYTATKTAESASVALLRVLPYGNLLTNAVSSGGWGSILLGAMAGAKAGAEAGGRTR